ncbi:helix-turn-helix transcriptional regulator [Flavobacterium sp. SH_e]|uniref:helix-turn-helix domain-containing protein n=1 Tax=Flavobacterium TaxID=237 RepID=UPI0021E4552B|nr:helix-turn-helix transcriptional regulator [Flavobacterium sp. SH_e]MCV2485590.1 helix-turn-helix transcriptional regulator [Flavobacterium sp. SH_e]
MLARLEKGYSQEKLADLIGMSQSAYSRRENGSIKITDNEWKRIAKVLDVKIEEICELEENKNYALSQSFSIPSFIIEHIELLKKENKILKNELSRLKKN